MTRSSAGASRPNFQRRHHEAVAKLIARARLRPNDSVAECLSDLEHDFADLFASDNGEFRPARFYAACDPETALDRQWKRAEREALQ
jgi:hypothetical protein